MNIIIELSQRAVTWASVNWTFDHSVLAVMAFFAILSGSYFWSIRGKN